MALIQIGQIKIALRKWSQEIMAKACTARTENYLLLQLDASYTFLEPQKFTCVSGWFQAKAFLVLDHFF